MSHLCKYCYGRGVRTTKRSLFENKYVRTDLACESGRVAPADCKGAVYERKEYESITVERLNVLNESGEEETGKEIGCYVTVSGAAVRLDLGQDTVLSSIIEKEIRCFGRRGRKRNDKFRLARSYDSRNDFSDKTPHEC